MKTTKAEDGLMNMDNTQDPQSPQSAPPDGSAPCRKYRPSLTWNELYVIEMALENTSFIEPENKVAAQTAAQKMRRLM